MRAAVVEGPSRHTTRSVPLPEIGPRDVRVRLEGCGVCHSNIPVWEGRPWFTYPLEAGAPGHEGWGIVDAVGDDVRECQPGERVALLSYHAYAEYDVAPAEAVVPLPPSLAGVPFPGEPLGCAMNIFSRSGIEAGQTVAILGIGFLGALLTRLATNAGARVIAISRRAYALAVARRFGAAEAIPMDDHARIIDRVKGLTEGSFADRVIEATGQQWPLDLGGELTRERGRLIIAGFHQDGPRSINMFLWNWRGIDVVNAHERDPNVYIAGIRAAVDAVARGDLDPTPLYTHRYSLELLGAALDATRERPDGFMKALVTP
ncbi:MAG TPA: zinc-binding dehydrogenase [Acidimicrobiia bacterium]|nr:zinc-binding dehydrogenase [Acidimicrobiia bacterium]